MGRHIQYADLSLAEWRKKAQLHVEALNHATREHPARAAAHAPVLGQLRGPAPLRRAARRRRSTSCSARGRARSRSRPRTRATPTSGSSSRRVKLPDGKLLIPGVIESKSNFIEHPELDRATHRPLREPRRPRKRHRRQRLRLRHLGGTGRRRPRGRVGQDGARWPKARASPRANSGSTEKHPHGCMLTGLRSWLAERLPKGNGNATKEIVAVDPSGFAINAHIRSDGGFPELDWSAADRWLASIPTARPSSGHRIRRTGRRAPSQL